MQTTNLTSRAMRGIRSGEELLAVVRANFNRSTAAAWGKTLQQTFEEARLIQHGSTAINMLLHLLAELTYEKEQMTLAEACDELVRLASRGERFDGVVVRRLMNGDEDVLWTRDEGNERVSLEDICEHTRLPSRTRPSGYPDGRIRVFAVDSQGCCGWMSLDDADARQQTI